MDAGLIDHQGRTFRKGSGCQQCHDTGFQGRFGIYEVMEVVPALRRMIHHSAPSYEIRQKLREVGNLPIRDEGMAHAIAGKTSLEEILRVTHNEDMNDPVNSGDHGAVESAA